MPQGPGFIELSEYDVTQRIIEALSNACTRAVLFSVRDAAKDAASIAGEIGLALSTVYKALSALEGLALLDVERFEMAGSRKTKMYRSRIGRVEITMQGMEPVLSLYPAPAGRGARRG